jgi:predicted esterase
VEVKFDRYPAYPEALVREWNFKRFEFDDAGLLPLLDFLHTHFGASNKFALAGHSTGATMALRLLLMHPDRVARAVFTGPKLEPEATGGGGTAKDGGPPVLILVGSRDTSRLAEADAVTSALKEHGITQVERRSVPGVLRSDFPKEVWEFVDATTTGR